MARERGHGCRFGARAMMDRHGCVGSSSDSLLEGTGFELAVPPRRERLWAATPGKHCRFGPEPVSGSAFRVAVSDWRRPEEPFAGAGPMVRIRFPPAGSPLRTRFDSLRLGVGGIRGN
jgi:hypothetical protein